MIARRHSHFWTAAPLPVEWRTRTKATTDSWRVAYCPTLLQTMDDCDTSWESSRDVEVMWCWSRGLQGRKRFWWIFWLVAQRWGEHQGRYGRIALAGQDSSSGVLLRALTLKDDGLLWLWIKSTIWNKWPLPSWRCYQPFCLQICGLGWSRFAPACYQVQLMSTVLRCFLASRLDSFGEPELENADVVLAICFLLVLKCIIHLFYFLLAQHDGKLSCLVELWKIILVNSLLCFMSRRLFLDNLFHTCFILFHIVIQILPGLVPMFGWSEDKEKEGSASSQDADKAESLRSGEVPSCQGLSCHASNPLDSWCFRDAPVWHSHQRTSRNLSQQGQHQTHLNDLIQFVLLISMGARNHFRVSNVQKTSNRFVLRRSLHWGWMTKSTIRKARFCWLYNLHISTSSLIVAWPLLASLLVSIIYHYQISSALSGSLLACSSHITCCQKTGSTITSSAVGFHTHIQTRICYHFLVSILFHSFPFFSIHFAIFCLCSVAVFVALGIPGLGSLGISRPSFESLPHDEESRDESAKGLETWSEDGSASVLSWCWW